ncbi:MAG: hypothetical protein A3B91_03705 [Candidatus Yanofskybacteria bacterium RIFCSPHIGHO2_02_FULL_41_29]|uniref:Uncharacterized protein n=1 Tax=Candidatus Yanofskybacteria bacterium RIFCSPHIGHO2_01_FULL_41_53 TaxID=1802663 RepID=A0A1F8EKK4_9BACT|nr:hypothetical protein [Candidatus Yanofskybacteria bacterium]OGN01377.1 MAG: hypothetical protein A2650_00640 [Candidatus Yanofskybacteria bacterium RIFCSPHIGHO2_01_FULL_41_53]OGN10863.1 MAG: hypothetical protein A3B91_03705 [Candidatus Yanofskybacteria bacterium RIFCSPHIGHO2_02_FULL_41_29]OGN17866.1 MAG: hypothetical protein A3F48_03430 [Candidatus Yanofskybacteria bacterium RIFCSPHIGHO2_12_FULL_41_9]OGN24474.1 MAG: hypothetical protein A2916_02475 [Candidatus Yanofskybacteria bacterium RIFC
MAWKKLIKKSDIWNFEENGDLEGEYVGVKENQGKNGSNMYFVKKEDGKEVSFWGNTLLDNHLKEMAVGTKLQIKFLGFVMSEKTGREYKNFEIETWEND